MTELPRRWLDGRAAVALVARGGDRGTAGRHRVAALLGRPPSAIDLRRQPGARPILVAPDGADCSFAHRGGSSLVGVTEKGRVGVDLELVRDDLDACGIARAFFSGAEADWLDALEPGRRDLGFTALWCIKEAALKAIGTGITGGLIDPAIDPAQVEPLAFGAASARLELSGGGSVELHAVRLGGRRAMACAAHLCAAPRSG